MTMLSVYQVVILSVYAIVAWFLMERGDRRSLGWVFLSALAYLGTSAYWRAGFIEPSLISGIVDGAVCMTVYFLGKYRWELFIWRYYQFFVAVHVVWLMGLHGLAPRVDMVVYSGVLELTNILIALTIGGIALGKGVGDAWELDGFGDRLRRIDSAVHQERKIPSFHKTWG
jgi:hypothetical protein